MQRRQTVFPIKPLVTQPVHPFYRIKLNDRVVWEGKEVRSKLKELKRSNPESRITIYWDPGTR